LIDIRKGGEIMLATRKTKLGIILGLVLSVILTSTVWADVIWEPTDSFYQEHRAACNQEYRSYIANGEDGYVAMYKSPVSSNKVQLFKNGYEFNFSYSYTDKNGNEWGLVEPASASGWVPKEELLLKYDNISFCEEFEDEFQEYNGEYDEKLVDAQLTVWNYPNSGEIKFKWTSNSSTINIPYTYTDESGNTWGLYIIQERIQWGSDDNKETSKWNNDNGWVCLNDPNNESIPVIDHQADSIPAIDALPALEEVNSKSDMAFLLIGALALVICVTAGIIIRVKMKKR
jgi:hypothetical protein